MSSLGLSSLSNQKPPFLKGLPVYCVNFCLLILSAATMDFVAINNVHVIFFLAPLFYWVIHHPLMMPLWFVFLGGLFVDFSVDGLLGLHAFAFIVYYMILYRARRVILSQPFFYQFLVFALVTIIFEILRWSVLSLLMWQLWAFFPSVAAIAINIVAFPFIVLVLKLLHRIMSGYGRSL